MVVPFMAAGYILLAVVVIVVNLDKVPAASEAALRPGSTHVSTILLDASQLAQRSNPRAYEAVQAIQHDLVPAVDVARFGVEVVDEGSDGQQFE